MTSKLLRAFRHSSNITLTAERVCVAKDTRAEMNVNPVNQELTKTQSAQRPVLGAIGERINPVQAAQGAFLARITLSLLAIAVLMLQIANAMLVHSEPMDTPALPVVQGNMHPSPALRPAPHAKTASFLDQLGRSSAKIVP